MSTQVPSSQAVGRKLRTLREERGIRRERVALDLAMSSENWRHYESGRNQLTFAMLPKIADIYGISLENLLIDLFDLRFESPGRSDSATQQHPDSQSDGGANPHKVETANCREFDRSSRTPRVLVMA